MQNQKISTQQGEDFIPHNEIGAVIAVTLKIVFIL